MVQFCVFDIVVSELNCFCLRFIGSQSLIHTKIDAEEGSLSKFLAAKKKQTIAIFGLRLARKFKNLAILD